MTITLADEAKKQALSSLQRYWSENFDGEISDIEAIALLEFILKEIGPSAYNAGVADAQTYLRDRVADLEGTCYEPEFGYWPRPPVRRK